MVVSAVLARPDSVADARALRCSPADREGIKQGLKDISEGKVRPLNQVREELEI